MTELYKDKDWLYQKYVVEELSTPKIAKIAGCSDSTIRIWLKKFNIETRTSGRTPLPDPEVDEYFLRGFRWNND